MIVHPFVSLKSVDELVATLLTLAEQRRTYYAAFQHVTGAPVIHPRPSVRRMDGGIAEVTFFREDAPDDETPGSVNRWQYLNENGEPIEGKVIEVTLRPTGRNTLVTVVCHADEYQTEFGRLLDDIGGTLPERTQRDSEAPTVTPTGDAPSDDAGKEVQAAAPTGDAPSGDVGRDIPSAGPQTVSGSIYDELPSIGEGTPAEWTALFEHLIGRGIVSSKFDKDEIARVTGRKKSTVDKTLSYWRNGSWPRSFRKSKES